MHKWAVALMQWPINSENLEASSVRSEIDQRGNFQSREYRYVGSLVQQEWGRLSGTAFTLF